MPKPRRHSFLAALLTFGAAASFVGMYALIKRAREAGLDTTELMFCRVVPMLPWLWWGLRQRGLSVVPKQFKHVMTRSILSSVAMSTSFTALSSLSLAQLATLSLNQPAFVALAGPFVLKEPRNRYALLALMCALAGSALLMVAELNAYHLSLLPAALMLVSALAGALAHVWTRKATERDPIERVVFQFAAMVSLTSLSIGLARGCFSRLPIGLTIWELAAFVVGMVALGTLGQFLTTRAQVYGRSPAFEIAGYTSIPLGMLADTIIMEKLPAPAVYGSGILMVCAGLLLAFGLRKRPETQA